MILPIIDFTLLSQAYWDEADDDFTLKLSFQVIEIWSKQKLNIIDWIIDNPKEIQFKQELNLY